MRVKYFYTWGYFHPITCGTDRVAANHFAYFRERGWAVDLILVNDYRKRAFAERFREAYPWLDSVTPVTLPSCHFAFRDMLFGYEHLARSRAARAALGKPADLFFSNYVFTSPLLEQVPRSCKRVAETHDLMTRQFALAERGSPAPGQVEDPLARSREEFWLRTELELYRLYDAVIMINADELAFVQSLGVRNATYVPQMYETVSAGTKPRGSHDYDLIFVGSEVPINVRGMTWFYHHVYVPYLWRHGVRLAIVGNICEHLDFHDAYITRFSRVEGSLDHLYNSAKLSIVPIFEGTGLSIKTLEGLAMGRAMVVTPQGARGLGDGKDAYALLRMKDNPRQTAEVILDLLAHPARRQKLEQAALAYVRRAFGRDAFIAGMDRVMASAGIDLAPRPSVRKRAAA